jgi:hypothetical protein
MSDVLLEDRSQPGATAARVSRLVQRRLGLAYGRPKPPRGVRISGNALVWEAPSDPAGVTHYRIYADDDETVKRVAPVGQLELTDSITGTRFYVESFNANNGYASTKAVVDNGIEITLGAAGSMTIAYA